MGADLGAYHRRRGGGDSGDKEGEAGVLLTAASISTGRAISLKRTQTGRVAGDRGALTVTVSGEREILQAQADTLLAEAI